MAFRHRIADLQKIMEERKWGGLLLFYSRDVFYYTGTAQPAFLFVTPAEYLLFVRSGFEFAVKEVFIDRERMVQERRIESVFETVVPMLQGRRLGTELDLLTANQFLQWKRLLEEYEFVDASPLVLGQRKKKDPFEIDRIREACAAEDAGHRAVLSHLREGVTELELAAAVEYAHRLVGHEGLFFMRQPDFFMSRGPIGSGANLSRFSGVVYSVTGVGLSPAVPAGPSMKQIKQGDLVVVDIPTLVRGYHADQTRTYCLGKASPGVIELHDALMDIADHVIGRMSPGTRCSDLYLMAEEKAKEFGMNDSFLSFGNDKRTHMIGHGIGLECTEPPIISRYDHSTVEEDYVIALEMHMMREGVGVVKIEDMIRIGTGGNEVLTGTPRKLFEVVG